MEKVTEILENTTWEHSVSETSFDCEYFKKELKIFSNINKKNLQALTEIVSNISPSNSDTPADTETGKILNRDVQSQFTEIIAQLKSYEKIKEKAVQVTSRLDSLKSTEKEVKEEIDRLKERLVTLENKMSQLKIDLKKNKKKYKEDIVVLNRGRDIFSSALNLQMDFKDSGEKKLVMSCGSSEEEEKYITLQMNENNSTISLVGSNFLSTEHLDLLKVYFNENQNITPAICVIRDLYFNDS